MRRIVLVELGGIIMVCFTVLFLVIITVRTYVPREKSCIQLLIDNKEQQNKLQEQINALNVRMKETDKTIVEHWRDLQKQLSNAWVKEAPTANGQSE